MPEYIGCIVCGLRFVGDGLACGCQNCGSSLIILEKDLSPEVEKILLSHGQKTGETGDEFEARKKIKSR